MEENIGRINLKYETNKHVDDFQQFLTIRSFSDSIVDGKIAISKADKNKVIC